MSVTALQPFNMLPQRPKRRHCANPPHESRAASVLSSDVVIATATVGGVGLIGAAALLACKKPAAQPNRAALAIRA